MPDRGVGWVPEPIVEELSATGDRKLANKNDELKQCGDVVPMGRGEPTYTDRNEVRDLPRMQPPIAERTAQQEAIIQAMQEGVSGSLGCQADPNCGEPFSPPVDLPFGDILAEERCDGPSS